MTAARPTIAPALLQVRVEQAAEVLFPLWPLAGFTAVNPLGGLAAEGFERAVGIAGRALGARGYPQPELFERARLEARLDDTDLEAARARGAAEGWAPRVAADASTPAPYLTPCELLDRADGGRRAAAVDAEASRWCAAFLDEGQAAWRMPDRELGLYRAWRELACEDAGARRLGCGDLRPQARSLPGSAAEALTVNLARLGIGEGELGDFLRRLLGRNAGWASGIRWTAERCARPRHPADLVELLALVSFYEAALAGAGARPGDLAAAGRPVRSFARPGPDPAAVLLDAYEWHLRDRLLEGIDAHEPEPRSGRPAAQAVFCIDVRSEGLRRHLERTGHYETLGFAGFFGLAIGHRELGSEAVTPQCPVLISPSSVSTERPLAGAEARATGVLARRRGEAGAIDAFHQTKNDLSSKFVLAELAGWAFGPAALARTLAPSATARRRPAPPTEPVVDRLSREQAEGLVGELERDLIGRLAAAHGSAFSARLSEDCLEGLRQHGIAGGPAPAPASRWSQRRWRELLGALPEAGLTPAGHRDRLESLGAVGLTAAEQAEWAEIALTMMGLTEGFGRLVLLCGHGSSTANNPYRASLDCGACGGNQGSPNARVAAVLLNRSRVRARLAERGIGIPEDTAFIAGLHDTTTDRVEILDRESVPLTHRAELIGFERDLNTAGEALAAERLALLPGERTTAARAAKRARRRAADWAEVRPEWGLAGNAAFVIGPREMTRGLDLGCRTFLHSYRAEADPGGGALETILTAPLVVANWINLQYYFSTVDPEVFGAGDKALHNVVGLRGVLTGPGGDLRLGLPQQSVLAGGRPFHEPVRLLAIVEAPLDRVSEIVGRNAVLREMLGGGWAAMCARAASGEPFFRLRRDRRWERWRPAHLPTLPAGLRTGPGTTTTEEERWPQRV